MPDPLSILERRVLGVLVEKALTGAAPEPLTLNAIVTGSNQKSNRDPVMTVEEPEVDGALESLQQKGLVFRVTGGRVDRWRHNAYDTWQVSKPELAVLGELLLRGPQTAAEARSRASRMEPLDNETATSTIKGLVEKQFVVWLTPEGRRGAILTHNLYPPEELERLKTSRSSGMSAAEIAHPAAASSPSSDRATALEARLNEAFAEIDRLRAEVQELRALVTGRQEEREEAATPVAPAA
jgi:uncharacterized protein YceH (UPF0502 family)